MCFVTMAHHHVHEHAEERGAVTKTSFEVLAHGLAWQRPFVKSTLTPTDGNLLQSGESKILETKFESRRRLDILNAGGWVSLLAHESVCYMTRLSFKDTVVSEGNLKGVIG